MALKGPMLPSLRQQERETSAESFLPQREQSHPGASGRTGRMRGVNAAQVAGIACNLGGTTEVLRLSPHASDRERQGRAQAVFLLCGAPSAVFQIQR